MRAVNDGARLPVTSLFSGNPARPLTARMWGAWPQLYSCLSVTIVPSLDKSQVQQQLKSLACSVTMYESGVQAVYLTEDYYGE